MIKACDIACLGLQVCVNARIKTGYPVILCLVLLSGMLPVCTNGLLLLPLYER